jgi:hypothetical protein
MTVQISQYDRVDFGNTTVRFPQYDRAVSQYDRAVSQYDRAVSQYDRAVSQYERQRSGTFRMASVITVPVRDEGVACDACNGAIVVPERFRKWAP